MIISPPKAAAKTGWSELARRPSLTLKLLLGLLRACYQLVKIKWVSRKLPYQGKTFSDALWARAKLAPLQPVLRTLTTEYNAAQCQHRVNQWVHYLLSQGIGHSTRTGIVMQNHEHYIFVYLALQRIGAIPVRVNTHLKSQGMQQVIKQSGLSYLIIDPDFVANLFISVAPSAKDNEHVPDVSLIVFHQANDQHDITSLTQVKTNAITSVSDTELYQQITKDMTKELAHDFHDHDIIEIKFTSGTSGKPKSIMVRRNAPAYRFLIFYSHLVYRPKDTIFSCLPLFHDMAMMMSLGAALWQQGCFGLAPKFSASQFWHQVRELNATTFNITGAMMAILLTKAPRDNDKQHRVRMVLGSACPADLWQRFSKRFGVTVWEGYGASDGGGFGTLNLGNGPAGSIGRALSKYAVVNDTNQPVPQGTVGELIFYVGDDRKNPTVEYLKAPPKVIDGWLRTGDLVFEDKNNYLFFSGRKNDCIRRRGENISAFDVENAANQHLYVQQCAAYPVPSDLAEEEVMLAVVKSRDCLLLPEKVICDQLRLHLSKQLPKFAVPRFMRFVTEIPTTAMEKIDKQTLKREAITADCYDVLYQHGLTKIKEAAL